MSSLFCRHWRHCTCPSGHGPLHHLQLGLIMGRTKNGQGQSPEKVTGNKHLTATTSAHKHGVKCQQDNLIILKNPKLHLDVSPPRRTESILVKLNKQKGKCVCVHLVNPPHPGNVTLSYSLRPQESGLSLGVLEILSYIVQFKVCYLSWNWNQNVIFISPSIYSGL